MSYIESNNNSFVNIKLTEKGREKLAKGQLTFNSWAIGDSEINYTRESLVDAQVPDVNPLSKILRPKDRQPNLKYFIATGSTALNPLTNANIKTLKAVVNNEASQRGFFSGGTFDGTDDFTVLTDSGYTRSSGTIPTSDFVGGLTLPLASASTRDVGDIIMFQIVNDVITTLPTNSVTEPLPSVWYKIQSVTATDITVDRELPDLSSSSGDVPFFVYPSGETSTAFGTGTTSAYWDTGTLSFNSSCDISVADVPVWNQNNVWGEDLAGITGSVYENHTNFGSYDYLGSKEPYLGYDISSQNGQNGITPNDPCSNINGFDQLSVIDSSNKSVAILHYTNNTISNFYGEFFFIDNTKNKTLRLDLPLLMYHKRNFSGGTGTADKMGMSFIASGSTKFIGSGTSAIEYVDLIEDPTLVSAEPVKVGKVFPTLKMVVVDDEEIVAAMSYKSNRNWTLPALSTQMKSPSGTTGLLPNGKTLYVTYILENELVNGIKSSLPCQKYTKITNTTGSEKDIEFRLNSVGKLPYMRKIESGWDGRGFYATNIKLLYQIVDSSSDRPLTDSWKEYDFTNDTLTTNPGETIDPIKLEEQNPTTNGFILTPVIDSASTIFDLVSVLELPPKTNPDLLQFGDEKFMYGNINTFIGSTIFKTIFDIRINSSMFNRSTNPTRSDNVSTNPPTFRVTEVGIYDNDRDLVLIGKLSRPIRLEGSSTIILELAIDF